MPSEPKDRDKNLAEAKGKQQPSHDASEEAPVLDQAAEGNLDRPWAEVPEPGSLSRGVDADATDGEASEPADPTHEHAAGGLIEASQSLDVDDGAELSQTPEPIDWEAGEQPIIGDEVDAALTGHEDGEEVATSEAQVARARAGAPIDDADFVQRARRREEKARRTQAKAEARSMRDEAKKMLSEAKRREKAQATLEAHMEKVATVGEDLGYDPDRPITRIPTLAGTMEEVSFRVIEEDRAFIRLAFDGEQNTYVYEVIEPTLTPNEEKIMAFLRDTLIRTLDGRRGNDVDWGQYLRDSVQQAIVDHDILIDHISTERILYYLIRDFLGFGPIDALMRDDQLEDISCDGPQIPIYIFHRQHESIRSSVMFADDLDIDSFVIRLAQRSGKHISIADPLLDATLPEGSRLQATLSREVTSRGSSFTIRKFREEPFTPTDLINYGTVTTPMCAYFWFVMEEGRSLIYAGGTASGKTTSLNAWCQFIPPEKKIVSIEDTREINLLHENWIAGVTRSGFGGEMATGKRAGSIDMYRLLESALRQRPEYLLVGEVRGAEALTLFQAMATGHAVYSTMHADSAKSAVYRLENAPINVPRMMLQTLDTIVIQGQVKVGDKLTRRVKEVVEIIGFDPDTDDLLTNTVFYWDPTTDRHVFTGHSGVFDQIQDKKGWTEPEFQAEWEQRMLVLEWMRAKNISHFRDFSKMVHEYYQRPDKVLARIAEDGFTLDASVALGSRAGDTTSMYDDDKAAKADRLPPQAAPVSALAASAGGAKEDLKGMPWRDAAAGDDVGAPWQGSDQEAADGAE